MPELNQKKERKIDNARRNQSYQRPEIRGAAEIMVCGLRQCVSVRGSGEKLCVKDITVRSGSASTLYILPGPPTEKFRNQRLALRWCRLKMERHRKEEEM